MNIVFRSLFLISLCNLSIALGSFDIFHAINAGSKKQVKSWSLANQEVNQTNEDGQSALIVATISRNSKMVKEILRSNINFNVVDKFNKTALDWAVDSGKYKIIEQLIIVGAKAAQESSARSIQKIFKKREIGRGITSLISLLFLAVSFWTIKHEALSFSLLTTSLCFSSYSIIAYNPAAERAFVKANMDYFFDCLLLDTVKK